MQVTTRVSARMAQSRLTHGKALEDPGVPKYDGSTIVASWVEMIRRITPDTIGWLTRRASVATTDQRRSGTDATVQMSEATRSDPNAVPSPTWCPSTSSAAKIPANGACTTGSLSSPTACRITTTPEVMNVIP
jgi:hypothetical protein